MAMLSRIFADRPSRRITLSLLAAGAVALAVAFLIGIDENLLGLLLLLAGSVLLILAYIYRWQEVKKFKYLTFLSIPGFFVSVILHNVCEALANSKLEAGIFKSIFIGLSVAFFFVAIIVCPAAVVAGLMGWNRRWGGSGDSHLSLNR
jgi:hypothetical protein